MCAETAVAGKVLGDGLVWITLFRPASLSPTAPRRQGCVRSAQPARECRRRNRHCPLEGHSLARPRIPEHTRSLSAGWQTTDHHQVLGSRRALLRPDALSGMYCVIEN